MIGGRYTGLMAMALALAATGQGFPEIGGKDDPFERRKEPENRGRRAEKDAAALAKAEAKRRRKAEKRAAHNAQVTGRSRDAATDDTALGD